MRKLRVGIVLACLLTYLVAGIVMAVAIRDRIGAEGGPVYTAYQVERGLGTQPSAWLGRTVRVTGTISPNYSWCSLEASISRQCDEMLFLTDWPGPGTLILKPKADPVLNWLRTLPGIGTLLPKPQPLFGGHTFRVRLEVIPEGPSCPAKSCKEAVVLDTGTVHKLTLPTGIGL